MQPASSLVCSPSWPSGLATCGSSSWSLCGGPRSLGRRCTGCRPGPDFPLCVRVHPLDHPGRSRRRPHLGRHRTAWAGRAGGQGAVPNCARAKIAESGAPLRPISPTWRALYPSSRRAATAERGTLSSTRKSSMGAGDFTFEGKDTFFSHGSGRIVQAGQDVFVREAVASGWHTSQLASSFASAGKAAIMA
jgi:hypothetical protein